MIAQVVAPDGEAMIQIEIDAPDDIEPITLGLQVAEDLKSKGALDLLATAV